jgi:magnesium-transporting ATPase (P-type)
LPYLVASDAKLVDGKVVGDPTEGALLVLGYKAGMDIDEAREKLPRLATLPFDPTYKLMATFNSATDTTGRPVVRCFVKGAAPAVMARAAAVQHRQQRAVHARPGAVGPLLRQRPVRFRARRPSSAAARPAQC